MSSNLQIYRYRTQSAQDLTDTQQLEMNYSLALNANPWLGNAPETLNQLATGGIDPESLVNQAGAMAGMSNLDEMEQALSRLTPSGQRALYGKLTEQQQRGLAGMGFMPPGDPADPGFVGGILGGIGQVAGPAFGVISAPIRAVAGVQLPGTDTSLFTGALNVMTWIGDVPGHMYRTIRQMEGWQQWVALGVGVAIAAALPFAAPALLAGIAGAAGGGTLATIGSVAGAGLAAGFASTAVTSMMVTSPTEWWDIANPFGTRGVTRGERIFLSGSKEKARRMLGGVPHLDAMARDIAANLDVYDLVEDFAGQRDATNANVMAAAIERVTLTMTDPGTPEYEAIFQGLSVLVEQPEFREAIDTLQSGKISFGRDVAGAVGLERGDFGHGLVSGTADALMLLAVDPFLLLGSVGKIRRIGRHGIPIPDGDDALNRLSEMVARDDRLGATVDQVMGAVINADFRSMPKAWRPMFTDMEDWRRAKEAAGSTFETREDFVKWIVDGTKMKKLLEGKATIAGQERLIFNTNNRSVGMGRLANVMREVGAGLDDAALRKLLHSNARKMGVTDELEPILPEMWDDIPIDSMWTKIDAALEGVDIRESLSYKTGNVVGQALVRVPGGTSALALLGNLSTMVPPGKAIALFGEGHEEDIIRFVQTFGRHFNMPSFGRDQWLNTIMSQGTVGQRRAALNSFMDSGFTAAGMRTSDLLSQQVDALLSRTHQAYALGGYDNITTRVLDHMSVGDAAGLRDFTKSIERTVGVLPIQHQAVHMVVPSLREMSQMIYNGRVLKQVARVVDADFAAQAMSRFIKPGWLLRIGFIPRAAGEEGLAWMMRVSEGGIIQEFGARSVGSRMAFRDARAALLSVGRKKMTPEQLKALDFQVTASLRPLANMMRRNGALLPDDHLLVRWSDSIRDSLESGLDVAWTRESDELKALRKANPANTTRAEKVRLAQLNMRDSVLLGKKHSVRRMILNGVHPDLNEAAALWVMRHSDAIMKSTSSMNSSLFERDIVNPDKEIQFIPNARELGRDDARIVVVTGEATRIRPNDIYFDNATHHQIQQFFADDLVKSIAIEEYLKYMPAEGMGFLGRENFRDSIQGMRTVQSDTGQRLAFELFNPRDDNIAASIENLIEIGGDTGNEVVEMAGIAADRARKRGRFDVDGILEELKLVDLEWEQRRVGQMTFDDEGNPLEMLDLGALPHTRNIQNELESIRPIIEGLDALGPNERRFVTAAMTSDVANQGTTLNLDALGQLINGETTIYSRPTQKLWRGIKDRTTIELIPGPEGPTLRLHAVPHREWGNSPNISTTIEWEHAMSYAMHPQSFTGSSERAFGAVIEMDGEHALSTMGTTWEDVVSNPILYSNADSDRGRGAYLIGAGSVDETEVALFMGEKQFSLAEDFDENEIALLEEISDFVTTREREAIDDISDEIAGIENRLQTEAPDDDSLAELDSMLEDPDDFDDEWVSLIRYRRAALSPPDETEIAGLQSRLTSAVARRDALLGDYRAKYGTQIDLFRTQVTQMQGAFPPLGGSAQGEEALRTAMSSLDEIGGYPNSEGAIDKLRDSIRHSRQAVHGEYVDIPFGKYKIHDAASMRDMQQRSFGSTSRFADRLHRAQFDTVWGQPLDEYWLGTTDEIEALIAGMSDDEKTALVAALGDFTFQSVRHVKGEQIGAIMAAGDNPVDQRVIDFFTRPTGEADFPTEWDGIVAEAASAGESDTRFFRDLDVYLRNQATGKVPTYDDPSNRWHALSNAFRLRGTGEMAPETLTALGQGWSEFYDSPQDLKKAIQYRLSQELMRPENQAYTKLSDQVLQLSDGTKVAKPVDGGLTRLYTAVIPQNLNPAIPAMLEAEFLAFFNDNLSALASQFATSVITKTAQRDVNGMTATMEALLGEYLRVGMPRPRSSINFANKWGGVDLAAPGTPLDAYWADVDTIVNEMLSEYSTITARKLIAGQDLRRLNDSYIQALPVEQRERVIADAISGMLREGAMQQPVARPLGSVAYADPRLARYVTNTLSDSPIEDSIKHMQIGQVDVPRQSVIGRTDNRRIEGVERVGVDYEGYRLDGQYGAKVEITDAAKMVETADGPRPGASWEQAVNDWAQRITDSMWNAHTRGFRETSRVRPAEQLNGRRVGRRSGDRIIPVKDGEEFTIAEDLYVIDENGKVGDALEGMSSEFFERIAHEGNDELMWSILGPMISDIEEQAAGFTRVVPRNLEHKRSMRNRMKPTLMVDEVAEAESYSVLTRSRVDDIDLEPATALPNIQIASQYKQLPNNMWDRFVRWGFDSVVGPSVDALVRKPMSFHYFAGAYAQNKAYMSWMLDDNLFKTQMPGAFQVTVGAMVDDSSLTEAQVDAVRAMAKHVYDEDIPADHDSILRFLSGIAPNDGAWVMEMEKGASTLQARAYAKWKDGFDGTAASTATQQATPALEQVRELRSMAVGNTRGRLAWQLPENGFSDNIYERFVMAYHREVPPEMWSQSNDVIGDYVENNLPHLPATFSDGQWSVLRAARQNMAMTLEDLNEVATLRTINNITPFLDSHEQRTMFGEYGRNFIPFWYAEENFIKRWGRTIALDGLTGGLATIRKAQLMYAGLRSGGVIRTDVNGKDWFVYPGSGLLQEVVDKVWIGKEALPIGVLMQASTDSLLPGVNDQFGQASLAPFIAIPLNSTLQLFPETQDLRRSIMGDIAINRSVAKQFVPGILTNLWDAALGDETSSTKYSSAMMTAIAYSEANEQGLEEGATAVQADEYLDRIRNHTRIILLTQAITGYLVPGAPSAIATNEDEMGSFNWLTGLGVEDPRQITTDLYRSYISNLGVAEGTAAFLRAFPNADLEDVVNPMAFTTSASTSVSGAPLPATAIGLKWYNENKAWVDGMPEAGAWFLPPDEDDAEFDYYAYTQQLANGLRKQKSPIDFLRSIKYRQAADVYFSNRDIYDAGVLKLGANAAAKREIDARWAIWADEFKAAHPIFAEELMSGQSRERRARTVAQLRDAVDDPFLPPTPHAEGIREMVAAYDQFTAARVKYSVRRDEDSRRKLAKLKEIFGNWVTGWQLRNPQLERLWSSVYEPEARLN